jgi:hypothetical protein
MITAWSSGTGHEFQMKKWIYVCLSVLLVLSASACTENKGSFTLINNSKEMIKLAVVSVCGQTFRLSNINPSQSAPADYKVRADSSYDVAIDFESGRKIHKTVGYVTNGMDFHHDIAVSDTDVAILKLSAE